MRQLKMIGLCFFLSFTMQAVWAADNGQSKDTFAVMNGVEGEVLTDSVLNNTHGKHFTINLPDGSVLRPSGSNGTAITHATLTLGGGAAEISGLPCCSH